jgi:hypothetical protein
MNGCLPALSNDLLNKGYYGSSLGAVNKLGATYAFTDLCGGIKNG